MNGLGTTHVFETHTGYQVQFRVDYAEGVVAFDKDEKVIGEADFAEVGTDEDRYLVTNVWVDADHQQAGIATEMICAFAHETNGAEIYFCGDADTTLDSGAHLTSDGRILAESMIRKGLARWA